MNSITVQFRVPKGKKNNNIIANGHFITNPKSRKDEKELAELVYKEAQKAGWILPINEYVEMNLSYDCLLDCIFLTITKTEDAPADSKWGGKRDLQNILDTVADALEANKRHKGILINDNRIATITATRAPKIVKKRAPQKKKIE